MVEKEDWGREELSHQNRVDPPHEGMQNGRRVGNLKGIDVRAKNTVTMRPEHKKKNRSKKTE